MSTKQDCVTQLQSIRYLQERLGYASVTVAYSKIADGTIPPGVVVRLGRAIRINPERLEEWIASGGTTPPPKRGPATVQECW